MHEPIPVSKLTPYRLTAIAAALVALLALALASPLYGLIAVATFGSVIIVPLAIRHPHLAVCALAFTTASNLTEALVVRFGVPSPSKAIVGFLIVVLVYDVVTHKRQLNIDPRAVAVLCAYFVIAGVGVFWARDADVTFDATVAVANELIIVVLVLAFVSNMREFQAVMVCLVAGLFLVSLLGWVNALFFSYDKAFGGLAQFAELQIVEENVSARFTGGYSDPNAMGRALAVGVALAFGQLISTRGLIGKALYVVVLTVLLAGIILTFSRGAMVGILAMLMVLAWYYRNKLHMALLALVPLGLAFFVLAPQSYFDRVAKVFAAGASEETVVSGPDESDESITNRFDEMQAAVAVFKDNMIGGVGRGNFMNLYDKYALDLNMRVRHEPRQSHSDILQVASEQGLLGLIVFAALWVVSLNNAIRACGAMVDNRRAAGLALGILLALTGYFTASLVLHESYPRLFWFIIALALSLPALSHREVVRDIAGRAGVGGSQR